MKVIFLDFDGVLNSAGSFHLESRIRKDDVRRQGVKGKVQETLCHVCTSNLQFVLDQYPDVKIVISSTWREFFSLDWLRAKLDSYYVDSSRVIDKTPQTYGNDRNREIHMWLDAHPEVTHYVIVDDNLYDGLDSNAGRFVKTTWETGLTIDKAIKMCELLSNENKKKLEEAEKGSGQEST